MRRQVTMPETQITQKPNMSGSGLLGLFDEVDTRDFWSTTPISPSDLEIEDDVFTDAPEELSVGNSVHEVTLCYVFSLASIGLLFAITFLSGLIICYLIRRIRHLTHSRHPYEEIYSTTSEISTQDATAVRFLIGPGRTFRRYHRASGPYGRRLSDFSSIYAEINEADADRVSCYQMKTGLPAITDSEPAIEFSKINYEEGKMQIRPASDFHNGKFYHEGMSGWTENILYESGSTDLEKSLEEMEAGIKRRYTTGHHVHGRARPNRYVRTTYYSRRKTM